MQPYFFFRSPLSPWPDLAASFAFFLRSAACYVVTLIELNLRVTSHIACVAVRSDQLAFCCLTLCLTGCFFTES